MCFDSGGDGGDGGAAAREAERQARIAEATTSVNKMFGQGDDAALTARNSMYATTRGDTNAYYAQQLAEDRAAAERQLKFSQARGGTYGSSQALDMETEFNRRNDRGLIEVANRADSAATGMKSSDEQARLGLISKILGGMDQGTAISSAANQMQANVETGRQNAMAGRMANVFSDLFSGVQNAQTQAGQLAAQKQYGNGVGNYFANNSSESGKLTQ